MLTDEGRVGETRSRALVHVLFAAFVIAMVALSLMMIARRRTGPDFVLPVYILVNLLFCIDFVDLMVRMYIRGLHQSGGMPVSIALPEAGETADPVRPYAIVVSVHNAEPILEAFLEDVQPFRDRLWIIDDASTDDTYRALIASAVRCVHGVVNRRKPGALSVLLRVLPDDIETVVVLDPDVRIIGASSRGPEIFEGVIAGFQRSGMAALCPRLIVRKDGLLSDLQQLEYAIGFMMGRRSLADVSITSGISVYRRDALESALQSHSLSVYAEDLRNSLILLAAGESIYYDGRMILETEGKTTFAEWFSQRVGWFFGLAMVFQENFADGRRAAARSLVFTYQFFIYTGVFLLMLHPVKIVLFVLLVMSAANGIDQLAGTNVVPDLYLTHPNYFLFAYLTHTAFMAIALLIVMRPREVIRLVPYLPLYFFYSVLHIVPITIGYMNWFSLNVLGFRVYRDHFQDEASLRREVRGEI